MASTICGLGREHNAFAVARSIHGSHCLAVCDALVRFDAAAGDDHRPEYSPSRSRFTQATAGTAVSGPRDSTYSRSYADADQRQSYFYRWGSELFRGSMVPPKDGAAAHRFTL